MRPLFDVNGPFQRERRKMMIFVFRRALTCHLIGVLFAFLVPFTGLASAQSNEEFINEELVNEELNAVKERLAELYRAGRYSEALPLADRFAQMAKNHPGLAGILYQIVAWGKLEDLYVAANKRIRELVDAREYAEAILIAEPLADSTEARFGAEDSKHRSTRDFLDRLYQTHERDFDELYTQIIGLSRAGKSGEALALTKRIAEVGKGFQRRAPERYADALTLLAERYIDQLRFLDAEPLFKKAVEILEQLQETITKKYPVLARGYRQVIANRRFRLANIYQALGYFNEAEENHKRALAIREQTLNPNHEDLVVSYNRLGLLYQEQGRMQEAELLFGRALAIVQGSRSILVKRHEADVLNNLGNIYNADRRFAEAEKSFLHALEIEEERYGLDHPEVATIRENLGLTYELQERYGEAESHFKKALAIMEGAYGKNHPAVTISLHNLAMTYKSEGRFDEAEDLLRRSLSIRQNSFEPDNSNVALSLGSLGWVLLEKKRWANAYDLFSQSVQISIRRSRREARSPQSTADISARADLHRATPVLIGQIAAAHQIAELLPARQQRLREEGFRIAQWASTSETASAIARMAARFGTGDPALTALVRQRQDLVATWQILDAKLTLAIAQPPSQRNPEQDNEVRSRLRDIDEKIQTIDKRLAREFPEYVALANPEPLEISAVKDLLDPEEALVEFLDLPELPGIAEQAFAWVVTREGDPRWVRIPLGTRALVDKVQALRCGLDAEEWTGIERPVRCSRLLGGIAKPGREEPLPFDLGVAHELYQALFGEFEDLIDGKHLLVVPSGPLTSLPFHVLVTKRPNTSLPKTFAGYKDVAWLGRRQPVAVLPSVASLRALRKFARKSAAPKAYIGYGNPVLQGDKSCRRVPITYDCLVSRTASDSPRGRRSNRGHAEMRSGDLDRMFRKGAGRDVILSEVRTLCPLPDTEQEVKCVAQTLGGVGHKIRLGEDATEADIKRLSETDELADYRVLHFATHGLLAGDTELLARREGEAALVMTPPRMPTDLEDDGLLKASEVARLKLNADWVILSACNTAGSEKPGAQALSGLARAFFYAGGRALLVSHWPVYSDVAVHLVNGIFVAMRDDPAIGRAEALRRAMAGLMDDPGHDDNAHPSIWAPFIVVGEGR
jgi:CHAT domain-containing protein/tetratricopeptide (TPR) repeat protein